MKRNFYPGDEWVYFKIYTGMMTADEIITERLLPFAVKMRKAGLIDKWFFIRYADPEFHLRIRYHINSADAFGSLVAGFRRMLQPYVNDRLISDISISSYRREVERYGAHAINISEDIFCADSECICKILKDLSGLTPDTRWLTAVLMNDRLMVALDQSINDRYDLMQRLSEGYMAEFGFNNHSTKQLNELYRHYRKTVDTVMFGHSEAILPSKIICYIAQRDKLIVDSVGHGNNVQINSILHMSMNRLFPDQARRYELILYTFMKRAYNSKLIVDSKAVNELKNKQQ